MGVMAVVTRPYAESLRLPATLAAPGLARRRVVLACDGLDDDARSTAELLTSELVANAVLHPDGGAGRGLEIGLHIRRADQLLRSRCTTTTRPLPLPPNSPSSLRDSGIGPAPGQRILQRVGARADAEPAGQGHIFDCAWADTRAAPNAVARPRNRVGLGTLWACCVCTS